MTEFVEEALKILGDLGDNRDNLAKLERYRNQLVPFIGAGLSLDFGYPTWPNLLREMVPSQVHIEPLLKHWKYEEAAQDVYDNLTPKGFRTNLRAAFHEDKLPKKQLDKAVSRVPGIASGLVITTNLDRVLERVFREKGKSFQSIFTGADLRDASAAVQRGDRVLLKLHGDYAEGKHILTLEQYEAAYGNEDPSKIDMDLALPRLLDQVFKSRSVLFLGCSLNADRTVRVVARVVKGLGVQHFALLSASDNKGKRLDELREWNVFPIFFPSQAYDRIEGFLAYLAEPQTAAVQSLDAAVIVSRQRVASSIRHRCGAIKILGMEQPIDLGAIYTDVTVVQKLTHHNTLSEEETLKQVGTEFRLSHRYRIEQLRVPAFKVLEGEVRLLVYGLPGSGKTTFLKRLAFECMEGRYRPDLVPVFISLLDLASGELALRAQIEKDTGSADVVNTGRVLLLLDGLDEIPTRSYESLKNQLREFIKDRPTTPIVMTCRIAARDYVFQEFRDIEIADFDQEQIEQFSTKWFENRHQRERTGLFLKRLEEAPPIRELGSRPLLLALLCLVFEDGRSFEGPRGKLYREALDVLITKWDLSRDIDRKSALNPDRLELLLEHVAFENFKSGQLLMNGDRLREQIGKFLRDRSLGTPKRDILKTIESDYGLIVTRAKSVYCFSHLTFQEYLTARSVVRNPDQFKSIARHFGNPKWREVWLLLANEMNGEYLVPRLKRVVDGLLEADRQLQEALTWVYRKAAVLQRPYYLGIVTLNARILDLAGDFSARVKCVDSWTTGVALDCALARDLDRALDLSRGIDRSINLNSAIEYARGFQSRDVSRPLTAILEDLQYKRPHPRDNAGWTKWAVDFRRAMITHRDIGHAGPITLRQTELVERYMKANLLLLDCMNESRSLTRATRAQIENELLLPLAACKRSTSR